MRKLLLSAVAVALIAGMAVSAHSATLTQSFPITVTFVADSIDLSVTGTPLDTWGDVGPSLNYLSNGAAGEIRHTITQNGYSTIDFTISATVAGGWSLGTAIDDIGADQCVVAGIFTEAVETGTPSRLLVAGDFGDEDVLGATAIQATTDVLARNNALADPDDDNAIKGFTVPQVPGGFATRSARYLFQSPSSDTTGVQQTVTVVIGAVAI